MIKRRERGEVGRREDNNRKEREDMLDLQRREEWEGRCAYNELSIETKADLYNFIMSLILRIDKCNNGNEASLMRLLQKFAHNITNFS